MYVTQPEVKPGCVLRKSNWSVLERRKLVDNEQVRSLRFHCLPLKRSFSVAVVLRDRAVIAQVADCKRHMNTFAFVGDLEGAFVVPLFMFSSNRAGSRVHVRRGTAKVTEAALVASLVQGVRRSTACTTARMRRTSIYR